MDTLTASLIMLGVLALFAGLALFTVDDRDDLITRAARTFAQTGLTLALAAVATPGFDIGVVLNVVMPAMTAAATAIHGALQPAVVFESQEV